MLIIAGIAGRPGARSEGLLRRVLHDHRVGYKADVCWRKKGNLSKRALFKLTSSLYD
jgi:hypothetical protein